MKIIKVKHLVIMAILFVSTNAFPITADELYKWLNDKPVGKTINVQLWTAPFIMENNPPSDANKSLKFYKRFVGSLSPKEFKLTNGSTINFDGVYLPDKLNQCTWINATQDSHSIVISGQFSGCTFALCTGKNNNTYAAHIFNSRPITNQNLEAANFRTDCGEGGTASLVAGFKTEKRVQGTAAFGYVIGTFVGGWKWKWVTMSNAQKNKQTILSCEDIVVKDWFYFPLPDKEK